MGTHEQANTRHIVGENVVSSRFSFIDLPEGYMHTKLDLELSGRGVVLVWGGDGVVRCCGFC